MEETIMQPEKSPVIPVKKPGHSGFFRRFWGPFFIILIAIMALVWFVYHNLPADSTKTGNDLAAGGYGGNAYDSSLPDCPDDLSGILNHEVFNLSDLDQVNPLGMLSPGGHTIPTDHMNLAHIGSKRIEIYSPGNVTLIFMDDKITYNAITHAKLHDDYSIELAVCKGVVIWLNHFVKLDTKIITEYENAAKVCDNGEYHFGTDNTTYYSPCQTSLKVALTSGESIGHIGTFAGGPTTPATSIDLGAYNFNSQPHAFANPSRYSEGNLHSFCAIDLFTKEIKDKYYAKLGDLVVNGFSVSMVPRVGEPLCGTDMQDVVGTLAGNWFVGVSENGGVTRTQYMMALVHTLANSNIGEISLQGQPELGGNCEVKFTPAHSGKINREFSEITPGDQIYCYQSNNSFFNIKTDKNGNTITAGSTKYLIQLVDATHLKIEKRNGNCSPGQEIFNDPFIYER